jgi:Uma2 family endonuclease
MVLAMEKPLARVVTADEWDAIPDTSGLELIDGVIHAMAGATFGHEKVKARLYNCLERVSPAGLVVGTEIEVRLGDTLRRRPDVIVVRADGVDLHTSLLRPDQVVLAIEVVSPSSKTIDRKHKPVEYAEAGIPHYWRVETPAGVVVHTYRLGENGRYLETGLFSQGDRIADPTLRWAEIEIDELAP